MDGRVLVPVAEYRPDRRARIVAVNPATLALEPLFAVGDHVGAVVEGRRAAPPRDLGSRRWLTTTRDGCVTSAALNPTHAIDFQAAQAVGDGLAICTGVVDVLGVELGGIALVEIARGAIVHEVPVVARSPQGHVLTRNPTWFEPHQGALTLWGRLNWCRCRRIARSPARDKPTADEQSRTSASP